MWSKLGRIGWIGTGVFLLLQLILAAAYLICMFIPAGQKLIKKFTKFYLERAMSLVF